MKKQGLTIKLLGLEDQNIDIKNVLSYPSQSEIYPHFQEQMTKYDFKKASTIQLLDTQVIPTVLKLNKHRFQCKNYHRVVLSETFVVHKIASFLKLSGSKLLIYRLKINKRVEK